MEQSIRCPILWSCDAVSFFRDICGTPDPTDLHINICAVMCASSVQRNEHCLPSCE